MPRLRYMRRNNMRSDSLELCKENEYDDKERENN